MSNSTINRLTGVIVLTGLCLAIIISAGTTADAQQPAVKSTDANTPLHMLQPDYPTPYGKPDETSVRKVLTRVYNYLDTVTPAIIIDTRTKKEITDMKRLNKDAALAPGDFRLTSYEWGVTYAGMLRAGEATGDKRFTEYTFKRLKLLADAAPYFRSQMTASADKNYPLHSVLKPHALDDAGALCAALIKASRAGLSADVKPLIDNFISYISTSEYRLKDGTLARNRPLANTLWLDDLFMSVPALAQMGKLTGERAYYDDAVKQVMQFSARMFNKEKGIFMHGWVESMDEHPEFHWARANGWAVMTMVELLDVLPKDHPGYPAVLNLLRSHIKGLVAYQDGTGFWHQLLDRNDSYLETSATAIYTYAIAKAINNGYISKTAYAPAAILAWNAVATKVNEHGQVEGTCVGTGMAFDPAFYYYRPVNKFAAHGYGPVLLAGAEIITLLKNVTLEINDSALQVKESN